MTEAVELVDLHAQFTAVVTGHVTLDAIAGFLGSAFGEVMAVLDEQGRAPAGPPFGRWQPRAEGFDAEAGFPTVGPISPAGRVQPQMLPGGLAATAIHRGDYAGIGATYGVLDEWIAGNGYVPMANRGSPIWTNRAFPNPERRSICHAPRRRTRENLAAHESRTRKRKL